MLLDSFISIGKTHQLCEDYSVIGGQPYPHIIVSDGCSSSKNSDIGSRIISLVANKLIPSINQVGFENFGKIVANEASIIIDELKINKSALDATLILAYVEDNFLNLICFGDGAIIFKEKKYTHFLHLSYGQNAPYYLTVHQNDNIKKLWLTNYPENKLSVRYYNLQSKFDNTVKLERPFLSAIFSITDLEMVMIATDGVSSFCNSNNGAIITTEDVVANMVDIKVKNGEYLKRRMKKMIEGYNRDKIYNLDDIAVASIIF